MLSLRGKNKGKVRPSRASAIKMLNHVMGMAGRFYINLLKKNFKGKTFPLSRSNIGWEPFYGYKASSALLFALAGMLAAPTLFLGMVFAAVGLGLGFWAPDLIMDLEVKKRNKNISEDLPYILDLLYISTLSGQNIYRSIEIVVENHDGEIIRQFLEFIENIKFGRGKTESYRIMSQRPNPETFCEVLNLLEVTEDCGSNMADILKQKSAQLKFEISQEVERRSRKVSLMILFPLAFLILPSFVLLVGGPLVFAIGGDFLLF